jgi:hypothetical protein
MDKILMKAMIMRIGGEEKIEEKVIRFIISQLLLLLLLLLLLSTQTWALIGRYWTRILEDNWQGRKSRKFYTSFIRIG